MKVTRWMTGGGGERDGSWLRNGRPAFSMVHEVHDHESSSGCRCPNYVTGALRTPDDASSLCRLRHVSRAFPRNAPSSLKNSTVQRGCKWKMLGAGNVERILQNTGELCAVKPQAAQNGCYAAPGGRRGTKKIQCGPGCRPRPRCRIRSACTDRAHAIQRSEGVRGDGAALSACAASFRERA